MILDIFEDMTLKEEERIKMANLMLMTFVIVHNQGTLRQGKQEL